MSETLRPESLDQLSEAIAWAAGEEAPLELVSQGSKRDLGRPVQASYDLDLSSFSGITLYEPEELVLSAGAATPIAEIRAALSQHRQHLAFEPADLGPLLGGAENAASIGGVLACNLAGPRRILAGAARDHFLGFSAVSGRGEPFKAGGRVVKNVTGYDLCKLMAGSYGTLAAMTEVTIKVLPAPEKVRTVLLLGLDDEAACQAMTKALTSKHELSAAAHLPKAIAAESTVSYVAQAGDAVTALRVEGPGPSVDHRCAALRRELADLGETEELHSSNSASLWREVGGVRPFVGQSALAVWRVSVPPQSGRLVARQVADDPNCRYFYDWGGGLLWIGLPAEGDAGASKLRAAIAECGGHASLISAPESLRASVPVFQPLDPAKATLTDRIKEGFDPKRILNPGRLYPGL